MTTRPCCTFFLLTLEQESAAYSVLPRRFLRARKWIIQDAYQQFKDTEEWRKANQLEVLYDTIDVDAYEETRRLVRCAMPIFLTFANGTTVQYPQWTGRRDRRFVEPSG